MHRRNFLSRLVSFAPQSVCASGLVHSIARELTASAAELKAPKRLVVWSLANGLDGTRYRPKSMGKRNSVAASDLPIELAPCLAPLEPYKKDLLLVEGFSNPLNVGLHGNGFAALSYAKGENEEQPGGQSIDRFIAAAIGGQSKFPSINLVTAFTGAEPSHRSADGKGKMFPGEKSPLVAYRKLFADIGASAQAKNDAAKRIAREKRLMGFVKDDLSRLNKLLPASEREKLTQYTDSLNDMEMRLSLTTDSSSCNPAGLSMVSDGGSEEYERMAVTDELVENQLSLGFNALLCGLSRVLTLNFGTSSGGLSHYGFKKLKNAGSHHQYHHAMNPDALLEIDQYIFGKVANFWKRLREVSEGSGTMADNTVMLIVNDGGGSHHNGTDHLPMLLMGSLGGAFRTGRFVTLPAKESGYEAYKGDHAGSDLFVSVANAMGVPATTFGDPTLCRGPLAVLK